jgi:uncharacterized protein (TIGR02996 family)
MTAEERGFLSAIKKSPTDATARGAYADWLDENGRPYEALLQRGKAELSEVYFKIRRKSDGLFSEGTTTSGGSHWSTKGKLWRKLHVLRSHLRNYVQLHRAWTSVRFVVKYYDDTSWDDLEVVVVEVRVTVGAVLPLVLRQDQSGPAEVIITEPLGQPGADD